jgi:hypothetical protein
VGRAAHPRRKEGAEALTTWTWSAVPADPARFENLVACHLLKWVHFEQDVRGRDVDLRYLRDVEGGEVNSWWSKAGRRG